MINKIATHQSNIQIIIDPILSNTNIPVTLDKNIDTNAINTQNTATESSNITAKLALSASLTDSTSHKSFL
jgi:hypothetical protein